jgi:O-antigen/teichoic acid export membrane protein
LTQVDETRLDPKVKSLRRHTASGALINSAFQIGLAGLGALQRVAVAAFLTREEFGLWGVVLTILVTLAWLKNIGIADKYIQQSEPDQEAAFQKAFTMELAISGLYFLVVLLVLPIYVLAYGTAELILPAVVLALLVPITAFHAPEWIAYRRMQYLRQRVLTSVYPVVTFVVTIALGIAGLGYWCLIIGFLAGGVAGAVVCLITSPFRIRLRFDRETLRNYASFSWPLLASGLTQLVIVQGSLIAANRVEGLAAIGSIGLAVSIVIFADRVDAIVSQTIYPAVCAVVDRREVLYETFVKTNRIALMWAIPFSTAVALFAHDMTRYVLGEQWVPAAGLIAALALSSGIGQVAFNWAVFMRALDRTRPLFVAALVDLVVFLLVSLPSILLFGLTGYAAGIWATVLGQIVVRGYYMRDLFPGFSVLSQLARAIVPTVPAAAGVIATRLALPDGRSPGRALAEAVAFCALAIACSYLFERRLIHEMAGYLRRGTHPEPAAAT